MKFIANFNPRTVIPGNGRRMFAAQACLWLLVVSSHAQTAQTLARFQAGTQALQANRLDEAVTDFELVTQAAPRFAEAYLNLGIALSQQGKDAEAAKALTTASTLKPELRGAHLFLGISLYRLSEFKPALAALRKETSLSPRDAQAWMWEGIADLAVDQVSPAVAALDHAATLDPNNVDILYHRGRAALALSRQSYERMFQLDPHSWHVHQVLAQADIDAGRDADAIDQYGLAIAAAPPQSGLHEALGSSLWRMGRYAEAQQAFEQALDIDPNDTLAMYKLGCLRVDRSMPGEAKPLLLKVIIRDPTLKFAAYYLGRAEIQLGENAPAIEHFQQTIHENVDDEITKQAWFQLSRAYRRLGNIPASDQAQAQYRILEQQNKDAQQEKLSKRMTANDRDATLPPPPAEPADTQP